MGDQDAGSGSGGGLWIYPLPFGAIVAPLRHQLSAFLQSNADRVPGRGVTVLDFGGFG